MDSSFEAMGESSGDQCAESVSSWDESSVSKHTSCEDTDVDDDALRDGDEDADVSNVSGMLSSLDISRGSIGWAEEDSGDGFEVCSNLVDVGSSDGQDSCDGWGGDDDGGDFEPCSAAQATPCDMESKQQPPTLGKRRPWFSGAYDHPRWGTKKGSLHKTAVKRLNQKFFEPCDLGWYRHGRQEKCPNGGACLDLIREKLHLAGITNKIKGARSCIEEFHQIPPNKRSQHLLDKAVCFKCEDGVHWRITEAGGVHVCRYAYGLWNGATAASLKAAETKARRGQVAANLQAVSTCVKTVRKKSEGRVAAEAWIREYLSTYYGEDHPKEYVKWVERFCIDMFYDEVYLKHFGVNSVPSTTFKRAFRFVFEDMNIRWRTGKDHATCDACGKWREVLRDPHMRFGDTRREKEAVWQEHMDNKTADTEVYERAKAKARRPGSRTCSIVADKAASENTEHPHLKPRTETKASRVTGGKMKFALQGVYQHGHHLSLFGLYPWVNTTSNYWWTSMVRSLQENDSFDFDELLFQGDGGPENWNKISFAFAVFLLEKYPELNRVRFSRLMVGHTHNDLDQKFSIPYNVLHGKNGKMGGRHVLGHSEWIKMLIDCFAAAAAVREEKVKQHVKKRRRTKQSQVGKKQEVWKEKHERMVYKPQLANWDVEGIIAPLVSKHFGGAGPIRDEVLKEMGHASIHVIEFYRDGDKLRWHYKTHMRDRDWIKPAGGDDVYETILTGEHAAGDLRGKSAKEVMQGLGDGSITPGLEAFNEGWWVEDCTCGCEEAKTCTCACKFSAMRDLIQKKIRKSPCDLNYKRFVTPPLCPLVCSCACCCCVPWSPSLQHTTLWYCCA